MTSHENDRFVCSVILVLSMRIESGAEISLPWQGFGTRAAERGLHARKDEIMDIACLDMKIQIQSHD